VINPSGSAPADDQRGRTANVGRMTPSGSRVSAGAPVRPVKLGLMMASGSVDRPARPAARTLKVGRTSAFVVADGDADGDGSGGDSR